MHLQRYNEAMSLVLLLPRRFPLLAFLVLLLAAGVLGPATPSHGAKKQVFDGARAFTYLEQLCDLGPRYSGSEGMRAQQAYLLKYFDALGIEAHLQPFGEVVRKRHPQTGEVTPMANFIATLHPEAPRRILLCAHYDTRPRPDQDPNPRLREEGVFLGANDGASGVALLMEMAKHLATPGQLGVDIVFFDAEEYIWDTRRDQYFLGSEHFARQYRDDAPAHRYEFGVLVDMVGDARLNLLQERYSLSWEATRPLVKEIWATAKKLRVREFVPRALPIPVRDDHLPLNQIAKIPVCNVIDFQYPNVRNSYWHTTADIPENCSADSLGKVGHVLLTWLRSKR